jgi:ribonucleases P/MRP protein subunit RPP40
VVPVHKGGKEKDKMEKKRPVSLTVIPCKLLEKSICDRVYDNANSQDLLDDGQFAYRKGRSAVGQLLETTNEWANMLNNNHSVDIIFFDFKSAFESVTHSKLIKMLPAFGTGNRIREWFRAFLRERRFCVKVNGHLSEWAAVSSGCPQGTVAGPLAYNLYTNFLNNSLHQNTRLKVYADDSKMFAVVDHGEQANDLQSSVDSWVSDVDELDLNLTIEKCFVMHLGKNNAKHTYYIKGIPLKVTRTARDLGVTMSDDLRFKEHIDEVIKRSSTKACLILRCFQIDRVDPYIKLFESLVVPTIMYGSEIWSPQFVKDKKRLQRVIDKFYERVEFRCHIEKYSLPRPSMESMLINKDIKMLLTLKNRDRLDRIFDIRKIGENGDMTIYPMSQARSWRMGAQIFSFYAWRVASAINYKYKI